ncbi:type II toxin-antitoxin system RelN family antitoxin [Leptolyngbya sp. AN03gr2]|uniref:type II toxin-antitoxin system RelN family antitoxin n=1 Tax=unclassified Leptolyngbya TaxID=2650499 RepID=UPI003D321F9E
MKEIETTAPLTEDGQLTLDQPLNLAQNGQVRVIVLVPEPEGDLEETPIEEIREGLYQGWQDVLAGRTKPVSQLWEGMDVE